MVKLEDVPSPRRGDQVVVGAKTYHVDGELPADRSAYATRLQVHVV
jgi:hypothetical protein